MDNVFRDVFKLNLIHQMPIAQERLSSIIYLKDFVNYYFTRFVRNLKHVFDDFSSSEIEDFHHQHKDKLLLLVKHPSLHLEGVVVPIPKGMIKPYHQTLDSVLSVMNGTHPQTIKTDLKSILRAMINGSVKNTTIDCYTKEQFDLAKSGIGKLFGKTGLTYSTASHVLSSQQDIKEINDTLLEVTQCYYSDIISIKSILDDIESRHDKVILSSSDKVILSTLLMTMAYRLSIFAAAMNHVQDIEHSYVSTLNILLKKI